MKKNFYICKGYNVNFNENKKLIFFHTPKCAGTSICNILSTLFVNSYRIFGPLTSLSGFKNKKPQITSEENLKKEIKILKDKNFIFGHFSINVHDMYLNRLSLAMLRNPIERSISHYNFQIEREVIDINTTIKKCFELGFIPDNIITRQFSGNFNKKIGLNDYLIALDNLHSKINLLFEVNHSTDLINHIISIYNLPNVVFQKQQVTKNNYLEKNTKNIAILENYNSFDIELFNELKKNKLFFKIDLIISPN